MKCFYKSLLNKNRPLSLLKLIVLLMLICNTVGFTQIHRFKYYSINEGLCHPFVYNINQDKNGFIWFGTGEGLCRYDGFNFISPSSVDSLPVEVINAMYRDSYDNLWIGFNNGEVWSYNGNYFRDHEIGKGLAQSITAISQDKQGAILVATQDKGIFRIVGNDKAEQLKPGFSDHLITALHIKDNYMLVGTQEGLLVYNLATPNDTNALQVEELSYVKIQCIKDALNPNTFWIGTDDEGFFMLNLSTSKIEVNKVGEDFGLGNENVQDFLNGGDTTLWLSTFTSGLIKVHFKDIRNVSVSSIQKYNKKTGFLADFVKTAFKDTEGNIWVGSYGGGYALSTSQSLEFDPLQNTGLGRNVLSVASNDTLLWLGGDKGILQINKITSKTKYFNVQDGLPNDIISSIFYKNGILWAGTSSNGVYKYMAGSKNFTNFFRTDNSISNSINHITGDAEYIYLATKNGIFAINIKTGEKFHYNTLNGLPHNNIEHLFIDGDNRLLFSTKTNGIYEITETGEVQEYFSVGKYELDFNSITQDFKGNIWTTTFGQGIFVVLNDTVINLTVNDGLKSNYCYSIAAVDTHCVWVGHRLGISKININTLNISTFDSDNGIIGDCNRNSVFIDHDNIVYFGTSEGLLKYNITLGKQNQQTPKPNILKVFVSDKEYDFRQPIELPYSAYKLRIDFIGLSYSNPKAVRYQYKLEGYDLDWSEITETRSALYPRIEDGEYTFLLKAYNSDGQSVEMPVSFIIKVKLPVWKTWWFITLLIIIMVLSVIAIIKYREKKQRQIQEYLEQRLDERTREVVEQKEEIEIKNRDITDSINYAQRIQASILPPLKRLQSSFSGSFIFYQPRDIVSGDFYWFDKISENKIIIVCADSTGHGVPGAFMSMIGTTLIKDICMRQEIKSPSAILKELDFELRATLNQNIDVEQSNDGMDIIVSEIDIKTSYLRYASAMRPMIVYRAGEQIYVKGSRSSVGGQYDKDDKEFKDEGIQLGKGDLIYMFSDGYPDQFGGSVGKKFKMARLKNLLRDIYQKPMEEQYEYVKSTFNLWKEDFEQVDDVLFMGIKI